MADRCSVEIPADSDRPELETGEEMIMTAKSSADEGTVASVRPAGQSDGLNNFSATFAASRAFPAAVAEAH
jgi:hypothetical protein